MEQSIGSKFMKEQNKALYCHPAYLTSMQSTSCEMPGWMNHIAMRNINNLRYADDTTLMADRVQELKSLLMKVREECGKAGLKLGIQKTKSMASGHINLWQIEREKLETVTDFIFLSSKIKSSRQ